MIEENGRRKYLAREINEENSQEKLFEISMEFLPLKIRNNSSLPKIFLFWWEFLLLIFSYILCFMGGIFMLKTD